MKQTSTHLKDDTSRNTFGDEFRVVDHSVSGEAFKLVYDPIRSLYQTLPQPTQKEMPSYYKSEDYISHTDSKKSVLDKVYHLVRKFALYKKLRLINAYVDKEKSLLDIGCGTGDFLKTAIRNGWDVTGIEPNLDARAIANTKTGKVVLSNTQILELPKHAYDIITLWHVFEHLHDLDKQIIIFRKLLKKNGRLIIAVPNYKSFDASYYRSYWAAFDVPRHLWHFSKESIISLFKQHEMAVEQTLPMKFDSYYVSLLSEKYKTGTMNPFAATRIGYLSNLKAKSSGEYSSHIYIIKKTEKLI